MRMQDIINEVHPDTLQGSFLPTLETYRKTVLKILKNYQTKFDVIYILGSWYGNLSLLIDEDPDFEVGKIINVESDEEKLKAGYVLARKRGIDNIEPMLKDANQLDYRQLTDNSLVINQSVGNIQGNNWFKNIPDGTLVLINARNNDSGAVNKFERLESFAESFPMQEMIFAETKKFVDPETDYQCFILLGKK